MAVVVDTAGGGRVEVKGAVDVMVRVVVDELVIYTKFVVTVFTTIWNIKWLA